MPVERSETCNNEIFPGSESGISENKLIKFMEIDQTTGVSEEFL